MDNLNESSLRVSIAERYNESVTINLAPVSSPEISDIAALLSPHFSTSLSSFSRIGRRTYRAIETDLNSF